MASDTKLLEFNGIHFTKNGSFYAFAQGEGCVTTRLPQMVCLTYSQSPAN